MSRIKTGNFHQVILKSENIGMIIKKLLKQLYLKHQETRPWFVIPADHKWFSRIAISDIIIHTLKELNLKVPELAPKERELLSKAKEALEKGE
jgi:hypothetical protein